MKLLQKLSSIVRRRQNITPTETFGELYGRPRIGGIHIYEIRDGQTYYTVEGLRGIMSRPTMPQDIELQNQQHRPSKEK